MDQTCQYCNQSYIALSESGHLRKCPAYLNIIRSDIQPCVCRYKPISLSDRSLHRSECSQYKQTRLFSPTTSDIQCVLCEDTKPAGEFANNRIRKNGKDAKCKSCRKRTGKQYKKEEINSLARSNYLPARKKGYYEANRQSILTKKSEYWATHKEKISERVAAWRKINAEVLSRKARAYRESIKSRLFDMLGRKCVVCGCDDVTVLTIDHIQGNGNTDRHLGSIGWKRKILEGERDPSKYQILCHSCNVGRYVREPIHHLRLDSLTGITRTCPTCMLEYDSSRITSECSNCRRFRNALIKQECFEIFGGQCRSCGEDDLSKLCLDHIGSNEWRRRSEERSGVDIYRRIIHGVLDRSAFTVLCFNCNYRKSKDPSSVNLPSAEYSVREIKLRSIEPTLAARFLDEHHYAGFGRNGKDYHGAYIADVLIGVVKYASVVRKEVASTMGMNHQDVLELDRFCLHPGYHRPNTGSRVMSLSVKRIIRTTKARCIVSFADPSFGHSGGLYRASNFEYLGKTARSYVYFDESGFELNKKSVYSQAVKLGMKESEYVRSKGLTKVITESKLKFVYRRQRRTLINPPTVKTPNES